MCLTNYTSILSEQALLSIEIVSLFQEMLTFLSSAIAIWCQCHKVVGGLFYSFDLCLNNLGYICYLTTTLGRGRGRIDLKKHLEFPEI